MRISLKSVTSIVDAIPFGWVALLLDLSEYALSLVIDAVRACRHLPITFYFFLTAHVAGLKSINHMNQSMTQIRRTRAILLLFGSFSSCPPS